VFAKEINDEWNGDILVFNFVDGSWFLEDVAHSSPRNGVVNSIRNSIAESKDSDPEGVNKLKTGEVQDNSRKPKDNQQDRTDNGIPQLNKAFRGVSDRIDNQILHDHDFGDDSENPEEETSNATGKVGQFWCLGTTVRSASTSSSPTKPNVEDDDAYNKYSNDSSKGKNEISLWLEHSVHRDEALNVPANVSHGQVLLVIKVEPDQRQ